MPRPWNKGLTKESNLSVRKISKTMRRKRVNNFVAWQERMRREGVIPSSYAKLLKDGDLAELIGFIHGDGHVQQFPRTECLRLVISGNNPKCAKRYTNLMERAFNKKPHLALRTSSNCFNVTIYQKEIAVRLRIPSGARGNFKVVLPSWIKKNKKFKLRFLRGLYEAEGSHSVHKPTYTYKFVFSNLNQSLLKIVYELLQEFGFHPHKDRVRVQLSRRLEVEKAMKLVHFREY